MQRVKSVPNPVACRVDECRAVTHRKVPGWETAGGAGMEVVSIDGLARLTSNRDSSTTRVPAVGAHALIRTEEKTYRVPQFVPELGERHPGGSSDGRARGSAVDDGGEATLLVLFPDPATVARTNPGHRFRDGVGDDSLVRGGCFFDDGSSHHTGWRLGWRQVFRPAYRCVSPQGLKMTSGWWWTRASRRRQGLRRSFS